MKFFTVLLFFLSFVFSASIDVWKLWEHYKKTFISKEGYVVDPYNNYRVTSEAQGYTLLISALIGDKETFYRVWNWTKENLKRKDNLFSWLWINGHVVDRNNATDADLFIAYALLIASQKWKDYTLLSEAKRIKDSVKELVVPVCNGRRDYLFIPSKEGYIKNNIVSLNVAYYVPFIFRKFYESFGEDVWKNLYRYTYDIYTIRNISTHLTYDLFKKELRKGNFIDIDGMRFLIYAYVDDKRSLLYMRNAVEGILKFYREKGYIPLKYNYVTGGASKLKAPFCFYYVFSKLLPSDKNLEKEFRNGLEYDKKNYYCYALLLIALLHD